MVRVLILIVALPLALLVAHDSPAQTQCPELPFYLLVPFVPDPPARVPDRLWVLPGRHRGEAGHALSLPGLEPGVVSGHLQPMSGRLLRALSA